MTRGGFALAAQADLLAVGDAGRDLDVQLLAGRQTDALLGTLDGFLEGHGHGDIDVEIGDAAAIGAAAAEATTAVEFERLRSGAGAAPGCAAEHAVENILEAGSTTCATAKALLAAAEGVFEAGAARAATAAAREALETDLAVGIDLAAVELLALFLVAEDFIGRVHFRKPLGGFRIVLVGVGMMLLGELAKGTLDRRSTGAPLHPQDLIGVAHPSSLLTYAKYGHRPERPGPA